MTAGELGDEAEEADESRRRPPSSILSSRLAVTDVPTPSWEELGLVEAKDAAFAWQRVRDHADWNEKVWAATVHGDRSRWIPELHGLFGIVGETILVAVEAEVEKTTVQRKIDTSRDIEPASLAALHRSMRFFAEGQANHLVIACHGCANVVLRTIVLHASVKTSDLARQMGVRPDELTPRSRGRGAWVSFTSATVHGLKAVASDLGPEALALVVSLEDLLRDPAVARLVELRNSAYHRWRSEAPGVTGIDLDTEAVIDRALRGEVISYGSRTGSLYTEGVGVLADLVASSRAALDAFVARMPALRDAWWSAFQAAGSSHNRG